MNVFKEWLLEAEAPLGPVGHLIDDLRADTDLPDVKSAQELSNYMKRVGACSEALRQVRVVWQRHERWRARQGEAS